MPLEGSTFGQNDVSGCSLWTLDARPHGHLLTPFQLFELSVQFLSILMLQLLKFLEPFDNQVLLYRQGSKVLAKT